MSRLSRRLTNLLAPRVRRVPHRKAEMMEPLEDRRFLTATTLLNDQTIVETANTTHTWSGSADFPHTHEIFAWSGGAYPGRFSTNPPAGGTKVKISFNGEDVFRQSWTWAPTYPGATYYAPTVDEEWWNPTVIGNSSGAQIEFEGGQAQFQITSSGFDPNHAFGAGVQINAVNIQAIAPDVSLSRISGGSEDPAVDAPTDGPQKAVFEVRRVASETQIHKELVVGIKQFVDAGLVDPAGASDFSFPDFVKIKPDEYTAKLEVAVTDDSLIEPTEQFQLAVTDAPDGTHYAYQPDVPVLAQIADNDWEIKKFRLGFDGDQTITRDMPTGHSYDGDTIFAGYEWSDLGNGKGGKADGDTDDGWIDFDGNGEIDPGEVEQAHPVSYVRSGASSNASGPVQTFIKLSALLDVRGVTTGTWKLKGAGEGFTFEKEVNGGDQFFNLTADKALADKIDYYKDFTIDWTLERTPPKAADAVGDPPKTSEAYGPTKNTLYVTGAAAGGAFHTVIDIGCRTAKGKKPDVDPNVVFERQGITEAIWGEFSDNSVFRASGGFALRYAHDMDVALGYTTADLLKSGKGRCNAWANFLVDVLKAQGVAAKRVGVNYDGSTFPANYKGPPVPPPPAGYTETRVGLEVKPSPAQGSIVNYSVTSFFDHALVKVDVYPTTIFDPSYGYATPRNMATMQQAEVVWEDHSIASYTIFYYNRDTFRQKLFGTFANSPDIDELDFNP